MADEVGLALPNGATMKNMRDRPAARRAFINNVVTPLATRYRGNLAIFGYDIMNEANLGPTPRPPTAGHGTQLRPFVSGATSAIHTAAPGTQVTCSVQEWYSTQSTVSTARLAGLAWITTNSTSTTPPPTWLAAPSFLDKPMLLGEYGPWAT